MPHAGWPPCGRARVLAERDRSHRPGRRRRPRPPRQRRDARGGRRRRAASAGADVMRVGVLPTPAVAHLVAALGADLGVMISASHNPMPDNGIKLFAAGGHKLPDAVEDADRGRASARPFDRADRRRDRPGARSAGRRRRGTWRTCWRAPRSRWPGSRRRRLRARRGLDGRPRRYARAGAEVVAIHAEPDGLNINDGCRFDPPRTRCARAVRAHGADLGIAHDGDADRCLAVDADGRDRRRRPDHGGPGLAMREAGELADDTLVATVMSNLGLHLAMREAGITVADHAGRRPVRAGGAARGRFRARRRAVRARRAARATPPPATALLTALRLMARMAQTGKLARRPRRRDDACCRRCWINVRVTDKDAVAASPAVRSRPWPPPRRELGDTGRVLLRPVGHRAAGAGDGRGTDDRGGPRGRHGAERGRRGELNISSPVPGFPEPPRGPGAVGHHRAVSPELHADVTALRAARTSVEALRAALRPGRTGSR